MKRLVFTLASLLAATSLASGAIFFEDFESGPGIPGSWTVFSVDADSGNSWFSDDFGGDNFAEVNAFGDTAAANDWLITPQISLPFSGVIELSFVNTKNFEDDGIGDELSVLYSTDYAGSGNPTSASWTQLSPVNLSPGSFTDVSSGALDLSPVSGQDIYVAFQYQSSGTGAGTSALYQVDDVEIVPEPSALSLVMAGLLFALLVHRRR